jgi:ribosomal protein S18 acetylase RimI-like enzyme
VSRPIAPAAPPASLHYRRPTEADHAGLAVVVDEWWSGRRVRHLLPRLWFRHFTSTSWLAETEGGRVVGFIVGYLSPDRPDEGCVHLVGVDPNLRRRGIGRELEARFAADLRARGARRVTATVPPGDRIALRFHLAVGFRVLEDPATTPIHGTPAVADYDGPGDDRALLVHDLAD